MKHAALPLKRLSVGVVLLAEPGVPLEETQRDLRNIAALGFDTVVLYPSVSRWDAPLPGQTAFDTIDALMDTCAELGLGVILELQGQVMQDADAPECTGYVQAADYRENGFHQPAKEALVERYLREVATHFKGHPALRAYDVFNEIGNHSRSPETLRAFSRFLDKQYGGDIQALNRAWATYFTDFDAIANIAPDFRVWSWSSVVAERDWQRFRSADFVAQIHRWRAIIREVDAVTPLFVDVLGSDVQQNRTSSYYGVSDWDAVEATDVLGLSCYGNMLGEKWWESCAWLWPQFWRHALSVAQGRQTVISEMMTANRSLFPTEGSSMTDELGLWSHQAVFHGIQGIFYWKYRPFRRGRQVSGRGLTHFDGTPNAFAEQAAETVRFIRAHEAALLASRPDDAGCALVFDPEMERLFTAIGEGGGQSEPTAFYTDTHRGWFQACWRHGVNPSYLTPALIAAKGVPMRVNSLLIPCLPAINTAFAEALAAFVRRGGTVVTESRFGLLDCDGNLQPHAPGFGLHTLCGIEEVGFSCRGRQRIALPEGELELSDDYFQHLRCAQEVEALLQTDAGEPALVRRQIGKGQYLHLPLLLGHKVESEASRSDALAYFEVLIQHLRPQLAPAVKVIEKGGSTDVSVLLQPDGKPWLVGCCNYAHGEEALTIELPEGVCVQEGYGLASLAGAAGRVEVSLPPRSATALLLSAQDGAGARATAT